MRALSKAPIDTCIPTDRPSSRQLLINHLALLVVRQHRRQSADEVKRTVPTPADSVAAGVTVHPKVTT